MPLDMKTTARLGSLLVAALVGFSPACATSVDKVFGDDAGGDDTATGPGGSGQGGTTHGGGGNGGIEPQDAGPDAPPDGPVACTNGVDCVGLSDACNQGACVNGTCERQPANEFAACDDGLFCTENETCAAGACGGGTPRVCPGGDSCHVGACDEATKSCSIAPGNDGAACTDGDPCTATAACQGGSCVQQSPKDCSFLDGTCTTGTCDAKLGCVPVTDKDGTACDDGFFCTIEDVCKAGECGGVPNTCAPPGDVCLVGTCDEGSKSCVAVPGNDGAKCSSGDLCLGGQTCSAGKCGGGGPANEGLKCPPADACQVGTTCSGGVCGNAASVIAQCIDGDGCCPPGCEQKDDDCTPLAKASYDASLTFTDALPSTTMGLAWDGTSFWSCSGGSAVGDRLARYSPNGTLMKVYQPNIDLRGVMTIGGKGPTVYARGYSESAIRTMTAPGAFDNGVLGLVGGSLDDQSAVAWNPAGTELVAMIGDGVNSATVSRWSAKGAFISAFSLQGFNQNQENSYPAYRGVLVAGKYYLTYSNGTLSAWDATGKRLSSTLLNKAGTSFDSHFSLSYAQGKVWVVDQAGLLWRGYDVGL